MFSGLKYAPDRAAVPARSASYRLVRLQKCLQFAAESRAIPRWKPNPDEENLLYRKMDEDVSAHDLSSGRPRTLEEHLAAAYQSGRDFYRAQVVKDASVVDRRARELFAEERRLAFPADDVGEGKRAR